MPFTFAHPAAVVPLARTGLVLSALIVGSLAPDVEYVLRLSPISTVSHTAMGLFVFCVPAGWLVLRLWHWAMKPSLVCLLPAAHQARLLSLCGPFAFGPAPRAARILLSLLVGSATHLAWDAFTHPGRWGVPRFPVLATPIAQTPFGPLPVYRVLQHGTGLAALALLALWYARWYRATPAGPTFVPRLTPWRRAVLLGAMFGASFGPATVHAYRLARPFVNPACLPPFIGRAVIVGLSLFVIALALFAAVWRIVEVAPARRAHCG